MNRGFIVLSLLIGFLMCGMATAAERLLTLTDEQADHLGIRLTAPDPVSRLPLGRAPAQVVLPPENEYQVSAPQSGVIEQVTVALGASVQKGQVMARIQSPTLLELQKNLLDAASEFDIIKARLERDATLLAEGVIARIRWLETQSQYQKAEAGLNTARQTLAISGLDNLEIKKLERDHQLSSLTEVRAPVSGIVLERSAVTGQRVEWLTPLFRVGQLHTLWLEVRVPQERLGEMVPGDHIHLDKPQAEARIIEISRNVDTNSQTALVRAVVEQGNTELRPGMNVTVQLMHNSRDVIFQLPVAVVFVHESKSYVFVKTPAGYEARPVEVAGEEEHRVVVHGGLNTGEQVVIQGVAGLKAAWLGAGDHE
ncbi:MAG: efflux RND transporter periplasmic adaptor subunit [Methylococcaceae bacterium]